MRMTIKSRKLNQSFDFWMADRGGYVWLESPGKPGTLGRQICVGGKFMGGTIHASEDTFKTACRRWYREHLRQG